MQVTRRVRFSHVFAVRNPSKGSAYQVQTFVGGLICSCEDFQNQAQFFSRACCKHGYAVLSFLGFESLSNYIENRKE